MSKRIEYVNRIEYQNEFGQLHRVDGPARTLLNGNKEWFQNDIRHRLDGPAIEWANGDKYWHQNGRLHRIDGPAIESANGSKGYWINGVKFNEHEYWFIAKSITGDI